MEKQTDRQTDFAKTTGLRFYYAELIEKLNQRYHEGGVCYDTKNAFLTDLIEAGLEWKKREGELQKRLTESDEAISDRLDEIICKITELEKAVRIIDVNVTVNQKMLTALYAIVKATNQGQRLLERELENGLYEYMPSRFFVAQKKMLERYRDNG